jgi:hypothetical protein
VRFPKSGDFCADRGRQGERGTSSTWEPPGRGALPRMHDLPGRRSGERAPEPGSERCTVGADGSVEVYIYGAVNATTGTSVSVTASGAPSFPAPFLRVLISRSSRSARVRRCTATRSAASSASSTSNRRTSSWRSGAREETALRARAGWPQTGPRHLLALWGGRLPAGRSPAPPPAAQRARERLGFT